MSSDRRGRVEEIEGRRGDCLIVAERSSPSTLVELFHAGRLLRVAFASAPLLDGEESGVRLELYLWDGRSGVTGVGG